MCSSVLCLCDFWDIFYEQTVIQTVHEYSQPLAFIMRAVLLASPASSAGVHEADRRRHQVAVTNVLASCDGRRASQPTHTEPSTKLITAHKAHQCDGGSWLRVHRPGIIIDSRSSVTRYNSLFIFTAKWGRAPLAGTPTALYGFTRALTLLRTLRATYFFGMPNEKITKKAVPSLFHIYVT